MRPLEEGLDTGEWFIFAGRPHWIRLVPAIAAMLVAAVLGWWLHARTVAVAAVAVAMLALAAMIVERVRSNFVVTNRRLILDRVLLSHSPVSLPLDEIVDIVLIHDWLGHWAKTARVRVETKDGRKFDVPFLWRARTFRRLAFEQRKHVREARGGAG